MIKPMGLTGPDTGTRAYSVDDHELVRKGLKQLLEDRHERFDVGESGSAVEAVRRIPALHPDVAVLDARLPDGSGIQVCRDVVAVDPTLKCLILTGEDDRDGDQSACPARARGFVQAGSTHLINALLVVASGGTAFPRDEKSIAPCRSELTPREERILEHLGKASATGRSAKKCTFRSKQ